MAVNKPIQFKRSNIAGKVPTVSQLLAGELALNTADKVFYTKDATGAIVRMSPDIVAPLSLTYAKTDAHVLKLSGTADTGNIGNIVSKKAVLYASAPADVKVGANYADPRTRVLQDIVMVETDPAVTSADVSDSIRALSVYGIGKSDEKENTAYITAAGSLYSNHVTIGKSKVYDTQHTSGSSLSINMSKEKPQQSAINIEAYSDTNTSRVISINEGFTSTSGQLITSGVAPTSSGMVNTDPNAAKYNAAWNLYETPQEFIKMYSHTENAAMFGVTATGEVYYTGSVVSGEAGTGVTNGVVSLWTKANVDGVDELFTSYGTTFARTYDGKWYVSGRAQASVLGAEGSNTPSTTFRQIFSLPANTKSIYYGYGGNGSDYAFVITEDGTLYIRGSNSNGHLLTGVMNQSFNAWTVHPNATFKNPKEIYTTSNSTYLVSSTGDLWVGGYVGNSYYLGANPDTSSSYIVTPVKIPFISPVKQLLPGYVTGRVVLENGDLMACGDGNYGTHGISSSTVRTWTKSLEGVDRIYGHRYLLAVKTDGTRWFVGQQSLVGDKKTGIIKTWISANTIPTSSSYAMTQTVIYARGGVSSRAVHASTAVSGGATIKVTIPSPNDMTGDATMWNTMMIHNGGQPAPIFRIDGLGNVESTGTFKVRGQEVYHPGNPMHLADLNARAKNDNVFISNESTTPLVVGRTVGTADKEHIAISVEDTVSRIVHNNDEIAAAMIFTIKNIDTEVGPGRGDGTKASVHDLVFEGSNMGSKLSLDGNEVYHKGNLTLPDTSDMLSTTKGGYIQGTLGLGLGISDPKQPVWHQMNIARPLDATQLDSGIVRIESGDDIEFSGINQSLFKIISKSTKVKNAISVHKDYNVSNARTFNVNTDGYMFARNVNTLGITLNGVQGGVALGTNTSTAGQEWFWMAPYIKGTDGTTAADFGKELGYQVAPNTWYCEPKFTISDDLLVGCADSTRPKFAGFVNHRVSIAAGDAQNGVIIKTSHSSPSNLTLFHDGTVPMTGTLLRMIAEGSKSPAAGALALYSNATSTNQGTPSFQLMMNGNITSSGHLQLSDVGFAAPVQDKLRVQSSDKVWSGVFLNQKLGTRDSTNYSKNGNGILVGTVSDMDRLFMGIRYKNGTTNEWDENINIFGNGNIASKGEMSLAGRLAINSILSNVAPKTGATNQGTGMVFEPGNADLCTLRFDSDRFRIWAPNEGGTEQGSPILQLNRLTGNSYVKEMLYAQGMVTPIAGPTVGGWSRGHVVKDRTNIGDDSWSSDIRAMSGFTGTNATTTSFFVGFGNGGWNTADPASAMHVFPTGSVQTKNGVYGALSDERLKKNVQPASPKLADLLNVNVVNYVMKNDITETKQLGVIAQEVETIFPNMVESNADGIKTVKYSVFTPMLIKATQELHALSEAQNQRIQTLEEEVRQLKNAVGEMEEFKKQILAHLDAK